jgi:hypothetical protein
MIESDWDALCDITDELMATGRYPGRYEAMLEAQRQNPHLDRTPPGMQSLWPTAARPAPTSGNAEQQLNSMAKQLAAARHITFAQAYVQALTENPQLYTAYLAQHPRQSGG